MHSKANLVPTISLAPHELVVDELRQVEQCLASRLGSREPLLREIGHYLIGAGGKRARPAVVLLIFRACGGKNPDDVVDVAAAFELIHTASLLHDDIIDGSATRRGRASAFQQFGLADSLVAGDFLFSQAFGLCGRFDENVINWAAEACIQLTEGEVMQGRFRHNPNVTRDDYLEIIARKTASLFSQAARLGAYLAGASADIVDSMASCGYSVGMAFQVVDDLLDVQGDGNRTGKPTGADLKDGNPSLPLVLAIALDPEVKRVFQKKNPTRAEVEDALGRVRRLGVVAEVRALAHSYCAQALAALSSLSPSPYHDCLSFFIQQLVERTA